ncbi:MAG: hypothetical protein GTN49_06540 [candidate division Zixibacteria bacterium]|nr:hypothetical protein [candidate division Zixibacteria bacterium]
MYRVYRTLNISAVFAVTLAGVASADSWLPPTEQDYYAANEEYFLHVVPGEGVTHARGTLYRAFPARDAQELWARELANPSAPHGVLVADAGDYVVTFDEWGKVGYGPNVVVIYGPEGDLVKKFALEDLLTGEEIAAVPFTASSRWWGGEHYLDEEAGVVVLKVVTGRVGPDGADEFRDIRIELASGEVVE